MFLSKKEFRCLHCEKKYTFDQAVNIVSKQRYGGMAFHGNTKFANAKELQPEISECVCPECGKKYTIERIR